jgi:hypothetical protein
MDQTDILNNLHEMFEGRDPLEAYEKLLWMD